MHSDSTVSIPLTRRSRRLLRLNWFVLVILTVLAPATADADPRASVRTSGTLVMMVPTADGLLVAADSRLTVTREPRQYCDDGFKLIVDETHNAVATVTGISSVYALSSLRSCAELARAERVMDIYGIVRTFLADRGPQGPLEVLQELCLAAVHRAQSIDDETFRDFRGRDYFTVVLARFDVRSETSRFTGFVVALDDDLHPFVKERIGDTAYSDGPAACWIFGQGEYVAAEVFQGPGVRFLGERSRRFLVDSRPVAEVSGSEALAFMLNTYDAIEAIAPIRPPPWGIGGPIDIVRLHRHGLDVIQMKPQPSSLAARAPRKSPI